MATYYKGAGLETMLHYLQKKCDVVHLDRVDAQKWRLYVQSKDFGEYEQTGPLAYVLIHAFKPFEPDFHNDRERGRAAILAVARLIARSAENDR